MKTAQTKKTLLVTATAVLLSAGFSTAYAQDFTRPSADITEREGSAEAPANRFVPAVAPPVYEGRSVANDGATGFTSYPGRAGVLGRRSSYR